MHSKLFELALVFATLSFLAVGGGNAVLPSMELMVVHINQWLTPEQFINMFSIGQIAPGPNMTMVALIGEKIDGMAGAVVVLLAFFIPSSILVLIAGRIWKHFEGNVWQESVQNAFAPITIGLMLGGVWAIGKHAIDGGFSAIIAVTVALVLMYKKINPVYLIAIASTLSVTKGVLF